MVGCMYYELPTLDTIIVFKLSSNILKHYVRCILHTIRHEFILINRDSYL